MSAVSRKRSRSADSDFPEGKSKKSKTSLQAALGLIASARAFYQCCHCLAVDALVLELTCKHTLCAICVHMLQLYDKTPPAPDAVIAIVLPKKVRFLSKEHPKVIAASDKVTGDDFSRKGLCCPECKTYPMPTFQHFLLPASHATLRTKINKEYLSVMQAAYEGFSNKDIMKLSICPFCDASVQQEDFVLHLESKCDRRPLFNCPISDDCEKPVCAVVCDSRVQEASWCHALRHHLEDECESRCFHCQFCDESDMLFFEFERHIDRHRINWDIFVQAKEQLAIVVATANPNKVDFSKLETVTHELLAADAE